MTKKRISVSEEITAALHHAVDSTEGLSPEEQLVAMAGHIEGLRQQLPKLWASEYEMHVKTVLN